MTLADHLRLVEVRRAVDTAREVIETLEGLPFTVVGGWAVHAHGSAVPSVDMDLWIPFSAHDAVYGAFLDRHDVQLDVPAGSQRFNLDIEYVNDRNPLFGTGLSYPRSALATEERALFGRRVRVLTGPDLLFAKAKAFHDRSKQWAISQDPVRLAALRLRDPETAAFIVERGEAYFLRKAGKDLLDIRFLQGAGHEMGGPEALRPVVAAPLKDPHPVLDAWGEM